MIYPITPSMVYGPAAREIMEGYDSLEIIDFRPPLSKENFFNKAGYPEFCTGGNFILEPRFIIQGKPKNKTFTVDKAWE